MAVKKEVQEEVFIDKKINDILDNNMARYAEKVVFDRAIPLDKDGLKPVNRRIAFSMFKDGITSSKSHRKVASITGNVMGNYHPHGDSSISSAIALMSQEWRNNLCLIDIEGNNGSIDGDNAAAARYIEARMTKEAELLFGGIEHNVVEFSKTYDNRNEEPNVLPAKWPVLFTNGSSGIGIGFATNIPPNNVLELMKAAIYFNKNENATLKQLRRYVQAPDFPTGGIIVDNGEIDKMYATGTGKIIVRGKVVKENNAIIITEIPYETTKTALKLSIAEAVTKAKIDDQFVAIEDESTSDRDIRIIVKLKRGTDVDKIEQFLYNKTLLQTNFSANNICISDNKPTLMTLDNYIKIFVNFRRECVEKESVSILEISQKRKHIVEGFLKMSEFPDEIIREIKKAKGKADSSQRLQDVFKFTKAQADAIVTMQLYRISRQDIEELEKENVVLEERIAYHEKVINDKSFLIEVVDKELKETSKLLKVHTRRTEVVKEEELKTVKVNETELKKAQPAIVTISTHSAQRMTQQMYGNSKDNSVNPVIAVKDSKTTDALVMFTKQGRVMQRVVEELDHAGLKSNVDSLVKTVKTFYATDEIVMAHTFPLKYVLEGDEELKKLVVLSITKKGQLKKNYLSDSLLSFNTKGYLTRTSAYNGLKLEDDEVIFAAVVREEDLGSINVSVKRNSGGRVTKANFATASTQGAVGSGTNILKITKPNDFATITTTNVDKFTQDYYVEK